MYDGLLLLLPPRNVAIFKSQYLLQYYSPRAKHLIHSTTSSLNVKLSNYSLSIAIALSDSASSSLRSEYMTVWLTMGSLVIKFLLELVLILSQEVTKQGYYIFHEHCKGIYANSHRFIQESPEYRPNLSVKHIAQQISKIHIKGKCMQYNFHTYFGEFLSFWSRDLLDMCQILVVESEELYSEQSFFF